MEGTTLSFREMWVRKHLEVSTKYSDVLLIDAGELQTESRLKYSIYIYFLPIVEADL